MKKIFSIFLVFILILSVSSISVSAAVSPTAKVIESSISSSYFNDSTYGSIQTKIYKDENKIVLTVIAKKGYTFVKWKIPDNFKLEKNSSIVNEKIILHYKGNISELDIKEITASFKNTNGKISYLSAISNECISDNPSSVSPTTSDISYFNIEVCIMFLICCAISGFVTLIIYKKNEKKENF